MRFETIYIYQQIITVSVADPGSGAFLAPGSRMGTKARSRSEMKISDHISESLETISGLKFFDTDADPAIFFTLDPGWKNLDPG
jgi:hypothetical protein